MVRVRDLGFWVCVGAALFIYFVIVEVGVDPGVLWFSTLFLVVFTVAAAMLLTDWWREGHPTNAIEPGEYEVHSAELVEEDGHPFWLIFARRILGEGLEGLIKAYRLHADTVYVQDGPEKKLEVISRERLTKVVLTLPEHPAQGEGKS